MTLALEYPSSFRVGRNGMEVFLVNTWKGQCLRRKRHRWSGCHQYGLSVYIPSSHPFLGYEAGITGSKSPSLLVHAADDSSKIMGLRLDYSVIQNNYSQNYWHSIVTLSE